MPQVIKSKGLKIIISKTYGGRIFVSLALCLCPCIKLILFHVYMDPRVPVLAGAAGTLGPPYCPPYIALDGNYFAHPSGQTSSSSPSR